jgi:hypothetical protein
LLHSEIAIYEKQWTKPIIRFLPEKVFKLSYHAMLMRVSVISGCRLPDDKEVFEILCRQVELALKENEQYNTLNFDEIEFAFRLNAAGELGDRVKHWQNDFNLDYFGEVIEKYLTARARLNRFLSFHLPKPASAITIEDWKPSCEIAYQDFRFDHFNLDLCPHECYDEVVGSGFCDPDFFIKFLDKARDRVHSALHNQKANAKIDGDKLLVERCDQRLRDLGQAGLADLDIVRTARRLAVLHVFQEAHRLQFKNLYRIESRA